MAEWRKQVRYFGGKEKRRSEPNDFQLMNPKTLSHLMANPNVQVMPDAKVKRAGQWVELFKHPETVQDEFIPSPYIVVGSVEVKARYLMEQLVTYRLIFEIYFDLLRHIYASRRNRSLPSGLFTFKFVDPKTKKESKFYRNILKEFEDVISNCVISEGPVKLADMLKKQYGYIVRINYEDWEPRLSDLDLRESVKIIKLENGYGLRYRYADGTILSISSFAGRYAYMVDVLAANYADSTMCLLLAYNARFMSGSNWSPKESYPDLYSEKYRDHIKIECFASGWNNQNYLDYRDRLKTDKNAEILLDPPLVDYVLTRWPEHDSKIFPLVVGTWPSGAWEVLKANMPPDGESLANSPKFYMMVNPIYTEKALRESVEEMLAMWKKYGDRLSFRCTLPCWDDFVFKGKWSDMMDEMGMTKETLYHTVVSNAEQEKDVGLRFVVGRYN